MIPLSTEPNKQKGGILAHTVILFSGSCATGKAAARALHVKLLGDVRPLFYVPAPRAKSLFGDVYMATESHPYLVSDVGGDVGGVVAVGSCWQAGGWLLGARMVPARSCGSHRAGSQALLAKQCLHSCVHHAHTHMRGD